MIRPPATQTTTPGSGAGWLGLALAAFALALATAAVLVGARGGSAWTALATAALTQAAIWVGARAVGTTVAAETWGLAAMAGVLAWAVDPTLRVWQAPPTWAEALSLSPVGGGLALALLLGAALLSLLGRRRPLGLRAALGWFVLPFLFTSLFLLSSAHLLADLGRAVGVGRWFGWYGEATFGRILLLFLVNEIAIVGGGWLMDRRWTRNWRLRGLLLLAAVAASLSPQIASFGSGTWVAPLPRLVTLVLLPAIAAVALAGLWAQTFLLTGVMLDAFRGRRPTYEACARHWREGAVKGAVYSFLFLFLVQAAALIQAPALWTAVTAVPALSAIAGGALLYPLARTIIESFDGSPPFLQRLRANAAQPVGYARGAVVGCGLAVALAVALPTQEPLVRFLVGLAVGALAYAGVDLARDLRAVRAGARQRLQGWRVYALGAILGGITGGALAWYLDAAQTAVITAKLAAYAIVHAPAGDYVVYPLFSKWGAISLGPAEGGVRLLFNESLSGVINWSLAAPLFSINLVLLTALLQRSTGPIRNLLSPQGVVGLVEQAIRVLRWGLWMAPVIYSFLRMAPDPTWYNQDGAIRTGVATIASWTQGAEAFRQWSLQVFLGLLAYDWFRVLIWFDHMGLRVATLVNLSFVGGDLADERAARWIGHAGRARCVPDGLRRFATWAPLLIPFYIPRGAEWDQVWNEAEQIRASAPSLLPPVADVLMGYAICVGVAVLLVIVFRLRRPAATAPVAAPPPPAWSPDRRLAIANGNYTFELTADGRGFSRCHRIGDQPPELDLTRRSDDRLELSGKLVYLRASPAAGPPGAWWSLGWQPLRHAGASFAVEQPAPTRLRLANDRDGVRAEAVIEVAAEETVERWQIRLVNDTDAPRTIELVTYQELALAPWDSYRRTPSYNAIHVGTCFVRSLGAIIARNRHVKPRTAPHGAYPFAREVAFHAAGGAGVTLTGYQDARPCFIGTGTLAAPEVLVSGRMRDVADEGLLYSFDPVASLSLRVDLPAGGSAELTLADGYAADETLAARAIARHLGLPAPDPARLAATFAHARMLASSLRPPGDDTLPYHFAAEGRELVITGTTPRPWTHMLANPLGHGALVQDDGEVFSFAGNAQQNGLTPCNLDTVPAQVPAGAVQVVDLATGRIDSAGRTPQRHSDATHTTVFGLGYVTFTMQRPGLELALTVFVPPDQPVEVRLLTIRNRLAEPRHFRVVPWLEMALAETARDTRGRLQVRTDSYRKAYYFANPTNDFHQGWAFVVTTLAVECQEHVRARFLGGPERDASRPYFVEHGLPDATVGDDGRRVAAFAGTVEVPAEGEVSVALTLGQVTELAAAELRAEQHAALDVAHAALEATRRFWRTTLGELMVETTQPAFDRLVNHWLPYQVLTARLWGRCGPNQRGGAFGYRDQLQDVLPLCLLRPELARRQILLHAAQQFPEGDVLQWWHPAATGGTGLGARNRASDPHLWLPYLAARYIAQTGDRTILDEPVPFLEGPPIPKGAEGVNFVPRRSQDEASLYGHCCRAIDFSLGRIGPHGLPLIGSGDWNDGLSHFGEGGAGESVWLGFFLYDTLIEFAALAEVRREPARAQGYRVRAEQLRLRLDGMWEQDRYPRLIAGNGDKITWFDALMGSWPVLAGAVDFERGRRTVEAALAALEREHQVLLLTPWFGEQSPRVPGKIADYPPGVRENGGQYSHGVSWLVDALVLLAGQARAAGDVAEAERLRARAFAVWWKISPLDKCGPKRIDVYGLPPHQQPADIYFGPGYEGRGGWSWYTGAAARMLSAAYALLGLQLEEGRLVLSPDALAPGRELRLLRADHRGRELVPATLGANPRAPALAPEPR